VQKSDILVYAEKDGAIVGFNLFSLLLVDEYIFYTIDEAMVRRRFQGRNIARNIVVSTLCWFFKKIRLDSSIKKFVMVSTYGNPKVINNYYKNKYITNWLDNSFYPSHELINLHHAYPKKYNFSLVDRRYPFAIKNLFPGSHLFNLKDKKYQLLNEIREKIPPTFDFAVRGDAWAFMIVTDLRMAFNIARTVAFVFSD
jgi:hypothetical protein